MVNTVTQKESLGNIVRRSVTEKLLADREIVEFFGREALVGAVEDVAESFDKVTVRWELEIPDTTILGEN